MSEPVVEATVTETVTEVTEKPEVDWKAKAREWEKRAKANADAATKLAQLEESQQTEAQKLAKQAEEHKVAAEKALAQLTRMQVALRYQIPEADLDLLGDGDEEQIEARAKRIAELNAAAADATKPAPRGDVDQGARSGALPLNGDPLLRDLKAKLGIA